jgi:hypothetical protein
MGILRSRRSFDVIHPPIKMGGLLGEILVKRANSHGAQKWVFN